MLNRRIVTAVIFTITLNLGAIAPSIAANWLMLQGTEPVSAAGRAKIWGFIQGQYQKDFSTPYNNKYIPIKLIGPNLTSQQMFNVNRARIGVRGTGMPIDSKVNYFLLLEAGNNGITAGSGGRVKVTDASITVNHIPFLRIRAGLFKYPGSEEGLQAIHVFDYINFSAVTNQLMLERFANDDNYFKFNSGGVLRGNTEAQFIGNPPSGFTKSVGAFRDVGIQIFDTFKQNDWEYSYAAMAGNGNGLNFGDNNDNKTLYGYLSVEKIFQGKGARREGIKIYAWMQDGLRAFDRDFSNVTTTDNNGNEVYASSNKRFYFHFKRKRSGVGIKYLKSGVRLSAEFLRGGGMIFLGPHKESFDMNQPNTQQSTDNGSGLIGRANGWYLDAGWRIPNSKFELDIRYDKYNRLTNDPLEINYTTITLGTQYFINKKTRVAVNYSFREAKSANNIPALENNLSGIGARAGIQITAIY